MTDTPPLCSLRHSKSGRLRRIRTDDPSPWLAQGYELVDATHASAEAIKAVKAKAPKKTAAPAAPSTE